MGDEVDEAVPPKEFEHVIEESDAGFDFGFARAVEIDGDLDLGLLGLPEDFGDAIHD